MIRFVYHPVLLAILLLTSQVASVQAKLHFEVERLDLTAKAEDDHVVGTFEFKNESDRVMVIEGIKSSCSCMTAQIDRSSESGKPKYGPGEVGVVTGIFTVSHPGNHTKSIIVSYLDGEEKHTKSLLMSVTVPEVIRIEPNLLQWNVGEESSPKKFVFEVMTEEKIKIVNITPTRPEFRFELETVEEGKRYEIVVFPSSTESPMLGAVKIETDSKVTKQKEKMAFFSVVRPSPPRALPVASEENQ